MNSRQQLAACLLRLATAANFLSAVAGRIGLWGHGNWTSFLAYAREVNSFAPPGWVPWLATTATVLEIAFGLLLLAGYRVQWTALGASLLTLLFALAMAWSYGLREPLNYSVFVDSTSALLLGALPADRWSLDAWLGRRRASVHG